jgi:hypothetical protein
VQLHAADPDSDELKAGHIKQAADDALSALNVPAKQGETMLPLPVYPASAKHPLSATVPVAVPELMGQSEHAAAPVASLKASAKQAVKGPPSGPVYPAFATQAVAAVEPVAPPLAELARQPVQSAFPVAALKLSAKQTVKGPPSGPVYPAFATQAVAAVEPVVTPVPELTGQLVSVDETVDQL